MKKTFSIFIPLFFTITQIAFAQKAVGTDRRLGTWGHGNTISNSIVKSMPFIRGWNFTFQWRNLEPKKGQFNWKLFDDQLTIAANNNLYVGFMVHVGQASPEWIYTEDGVPKVTVEDKKHDIPYYPYYLNAAYKENYLNMLKAVAQHVNSLKPELRNKIVFWMSAEGTTGDVTPYKGVVKDVQYDITEAQWTDFKKDAWKLMYDFGQASNPQLNILINPANNGMYFDYLVKNFPRAWFKAGSLSHTYQFDDEMDYHKRLERIVKPDNNGMTNRIRGEFEETHKIGWFRQSPQQNTFCIAASALHIGLDILNVREGIVKETGGTDYPFRFFNEYAGQRDPATASGAFCVLRDVLDIADTDRFPESEFGKLEVEKGKARKSDAKNTSMDDGEETRKKKANAVSSERKQNILNAFAQYGAKNGPSPEVEERIYKNDPNLEPKLRKENLRSDLLDKYNYDFGINLIPNNYERFLTQYSPNTTSRGRWRIGPVDQPYGRYARAFDHANGMNEMYFALDKDFFARNNEPHKLQVRLVYFDKGNGQWSFNYHNGKTKVQKLKVRCTNTNRWIVKTIELTDAYTNKKLAHDTDFSLKYVSGDDTIFSMVEVFKK